jgi:hypothetical protein
MGTKAREEGKAGLGGGAVEKSRLMLPRIISFVNYYYSSFSRKLGNLFERFCKEKKTKG